MLHHPSHASLGYMFSWCAVPGAAPTGLKDAVSLLLQATDEMKLASIKTKECYL